MEQNEKPYQFLAWFATSILIIAAAETDIPKAKLVKLLDPSKLAKGGI